jgi:hypothetical protein
MSYLFYFNFLLVCTADIVPQWNGGRYGDNLRSLFCTWWVAYQYDNICLSYTPFHYSACLKISDMLSAVKDESEYKKKIVLSRAWHKTIINEDNVLYIVPWKLDPYINWHDTNFLRLIRAGISPKTYSPTSFTQADVSVAIHVRFGGGFFVDTAAVRRRRPYHFPPIGYYLKQLEKVISLYPEKNLYVHIFTDDRNPKKFQKIFKREFNKYENVVFGVRTGDNTHDKNVLQDFFDMMQFDVLIRPQSQFSFFAELLGFFQLVICPDMRYHVKRSYKPISHVLIRRYNRQRYLVGPTFI